jgi:hypothetical protein
MKPVVDNFIDKTSHSKRLVKNKYKNSKRALSLNL